MFCTLACAAKHQGLIRRVRKTNETEYNTSPKICKLCGKTIPYGKRYNDYCSQSCAARFNNRNRNTKSIEVTAPAAVKKFATCLYCGRSFKWKRGRKYCSPKCNVDHKQKIIFDRIQNGDTSLDERHFRKYLIHTKGCKCEVCGWDKVNQKTGKCPIQMDHVDGNSTNNRLDNLRLLCPNCHSLTPTFGNLNNGFGRTIRRERYAKRNVSNL